MEALSLKSQFEEEGALYPISILNSNEILETRNKMIEYLDKVNWDLDAINRHKPHLYLKWVNELAHHPKIIESIKPLLGENILLWYSVVFVKPPKSKGMIPWHQDSTYWALNEDKGLTLWLALSEVNEANGCVNYIPQSHKYSDFEHEIENSEENLLARGQKIKGFNPESSKKIELNPGEASIHHVKTLHQSNPNLSDNPRLGLAFRYIPADVYPKTLTWMKRSATLVSGQYDFSHFAKDPVPKADYDPDCLRFHKKSVRIATIHTLFGDTSRTKWKKIRDLVPTLITKKTLQYLKHLPWRKS